MKCISCEMEINPKWKHAVDTNICPFCGMGIMPEDLKELFCVLRKVMDELQQFPEQLDDWMLANHSYVKTDSPLLSKKTYEASEEKESKKFLVKVSTEKGEEEVVAEKIQSEEKTNEFFKRAEAVKPNIDGFKNTEEKTKHLKEMVRQIKKGGGISGAPSMNSEMMEGADPTEVAAMQSLISEGDLISSALPDVSDGGDDEIPSVVLNMANKVKGSNKDPHADLMKLQQLQQRVNESRKNFSSGAKGSFSRS